MTEAKVTRRLAAILAADMVGYSRLMGADEAGTITRQKALHSEVIGPDYSIAHIRRVLPYRDPAWFEHFTGGLEKAGLPE